MAPPDFARRRLLATLAVLGFAPTANAAPDAEQALQGLLARVAETPPDSAASMATRIERLSGALLSRTYRLDPLGEGPGALIDNDPLWRLDAFDCLSLVETVLALARTTTPSQFVGELAWIRYRHGLAQFGERNHFMEADWLPNNLRRGVLADITSSLPAPQDIARGVLTRRRWLTQLRANPLQAGNGRLRGSAAAQEELRRLALAAPESESVSLGYARLRAASTAELQTVVNAIPGSAVLMIVRPNTSLFGAVGAVTQISHLGFVLPRTGGAVLRHASSRRGRKSVIDMPLMAYLGEMQRTKTFQGIKVLQAQPYVASSLP